VRESRLDALRLDAVRRGGVSRRGAERHARRIAALRSLATSAAWLIALLGTAAIGVPADAALERYRLRRAFVSDSGFTASDCLDGLGTTVTTCTGAAAVDTLPLAPVLTQFQFIKDTTSTLANLCFGCFAFLSLSRSEGPRATATGTGGTESGATLRWGIASGWTVTGSIWCNANPAIICTVAGLQNQDTVDPALASPFYDLGTWTYHSTGFTATPFIYQYLQPTGNFQFLYAGRRLPAPSAPALSLVAVVGAALGLAAAAKLRQRRPR